MSSHRRKTSTTHNWTNFEKHTLLCLMAKTMHLEGRGNCKDEESAMRRHAYMNVTTALNKALNGENGGYGDDIDKIEVAKMIDKMLVEKKGVVGKGGYMERATSGRITRGLKRMWEREPSFDYDGSLSEWNQWRKAAEEEKRRIAAGGAPKGGTGTVEESIEKDLDSDIIGDIWRQAGTAANAAPNRSGGSAPVNNQIPARTIAGRPTGFHDSFNRLPAHIRGDSKYAWANPANRPSHASSSSNIDTYRPSYASSTYTAPAFSGSSGRNEPVKESYRPPTPEPMFPPSLTHDYSSSPSKTSSYSGTVHPTTTLTNPYEDLAGAIQHEMAQRRCSQYKRPGILKRQSHVNSEGGSALSDMINPARKALFADPDVEAGEIVEIIGTSTGTKANREELPFNRLEQRRVSGGDTEMRDGGS